MSKFRKKPVVIEAEQYLEGGDLPFVEEDVLQYNEDTHRQYINTLEGPLTVSHGDWVIKGVKGEFYSCKPDIFAMTYEPADRPTPKSDAGLVEELFRAINTAQDALIWCGGLCRPVGGVRPIWFADRTRGFQGTIRNRERGQALHGQSLRLCASCSRACRRCGGEERTGESPSPMRCKKCRSEKKKGKPCEWCKAARRN